ncbi:MAG: hypothetical protein ACYTEQ_05575 [Planctomycetota bacterium]|jgi:hypothetical protein
MAILSVKEKWTGLSVHDQAPDAQATRIWTVKFDTADPAAQRQFLALQHPDIPHIYQRHPYSMWLWCTGKRAVHRGPCLLEVQVDYGVRAIRPGREEGLGGLTDNPFDQPPEVDWGSSVSNEKIDRDIYGNPITNSAGETPDPPLTADIYYKVLRIKRNEMEYNPVKALNYAGAVNSDFFLGFAPFCVRCTRYDARSARSGNFFYWEVYYEFQIRFAGWVCKIVDEGLRECLGVDGEGKPIFSAISDDKGQPVTHQWALDGNGRKLKKGAPLAILEFAIYRPLPFSGLGL